MSAGDLFESAREEVLRLHAFFVAWFRGEAADFAGCERAFAPDFRMVTPDGAVHERESVMTRLRAARGSASADFTIFDVADCDETVVDSSGGTMRLTRMFEPRLAILGTHRVAASRTRRPETGR